MEPLSLPCQGIVWLLTVPLALLFLEVLMCSSLVPSFAEWCLWAASLRDGQGGIGRDRNFCPPPLPVPAQPSLPSCL